MSSWLDTVREGLAVYRDRTGEDVVGLDAVYEVVLPIARERFPNNNHPKAKIRQKLQVLRDRDEVEFLGDGRYRIVDLDFTLSDAEADPDSGDEADSETGGESDRPSLFLAPLDDAERSAYAQIVETALDPNRVDDVPETLRSERSLRLWAFDGVPSALESGASIAFVHDGEWLGRAVVDDAFEDSAVGEWFWGNPDRRAVVTLRNYTASAPSDDLSDAVDAATLDPSSSLVAVGRRADDSVDSVAPSLSVD